MKNQKRVLRQLFEGQPEREISLVDILKLFIANYRARISELKSDGMDITNRIEMRDGTKCSFYCYHPARKVQGEFEYE